MIIAERAARVEAEAVAARAQAVNTSTEVLIAHLKLEIEKLRRALYGSRSERKARLLEQMELQLEDLEAAATEDEHRLRPCRCFLGRQLHTDEVFGNHRLPSHPRHRWLRGPSW